MFKSILALLIINSIGVTLTCALTPLQPSENYTHFVDVDQSHPNQYVLYWKMNAIDEIQFEAHCKTTGWVGIGISPNGGMIGSDIAIGWVDSKNKGNLRDCYASEVNAPKVDKSQDWFLLDASEQDGYTILKYKRKLETCDKEYDRPITAGTNFLIFAWNDKDPVNDDWTYHGKNRLTRVLLLLSYKNDTIDKQGILPKDTFTHSYTQNNIKVPAKRTYYYCDLFEVPQFDTKTHLIQFEMLINQKNVKNIHHLLVYECYPEFVKTEPLARECGSVPLPYNVASMCMGRLIIAWGIGGYYNYTFPKEAGYPFEEKTNEKRSRYFMFEMHYDNPELLADIVDSSGIKLYFTQELRAHDLGLMTLGSAGLPLSIQVPPNTDGYELTTICYPQCSEAFFPEDGIYAVGGLLHTHLAGRAVRTSLIRNDTLIDYLLDNQNYDFNYQYIEDIEPKKLYKGDVLTTTCKYNTNGRSNFTYFGFGTTDEMCYDFLYYYPKIEGFGPCSTITPPNILYDFYRSLMKEKLLPQRELNESTFYQDETEIQSYLNTGSLTQVLSKRFIDFFNSTYNKTYFCGENRNNSTLMYVENVKHYSPLKIQLDTPTLKCKSNSNIYSSFILFVAILINAVILRSF